MGQAVCAGAMMMCSFGVAPASLSVLPKARVMAAGPPMANIMDHAPMVNVAPFGMCTSLSNPTVASATSAALGVLTPMPCTPVIPTPWVPGSPTTLVGGAPALTGTSKATCAWGGVISITFPGQTTVQVP